MVRGVTYRLRVPVKTRTMHSRRGRRRTTRRRALRGGFLPAIIPLIAAAIGAVPGIASVALQAKRQ